MIARILLPIPPGTQVPANTPPAIMPIPPMVVCNTELIDAKGAEVPLREGKLCLEQDAADTVITAATTKP